MKTVFNLSFILFLCQIAVAQNTTASTNNNTSPTTTATSTEIDWANFENEMAKVSDDNWTFHTDQKGKLLYIDFESLGGKMNSFVLRSDDKTIVMEDNHLFDLPINTIYEVNLEKLKRGSYFVELQTYGNKTIREEIHIQ